MSLPEVLSELPDGQRASSSLSWTETLNWIRDRYLDPMGAEAARISDATERHDLYRDKGGKYIEQLIDKVFDHDDVKRLRKDWVEQAGYNNVTRRVVHELATLYRRPARRHVKDEAQNIRYQAVQLLCRLNSVMLEVQRLTILHRSIFVMFRVPKWSRIPQIDIVEPQHFRLVTHPLEPTRLIAVIIDQAIEGPAMRSGDKPAYLVLTADETFRMTQGGNLYGDVKPHSLGRIQGVLVALSPPPGSLIDCATFSDVIRAHKAVWFENVLLLKESKSATKLAVLIGDLTNALRKQALDSQGAIQLPEGVSLTPTDLAQDLTPFRDTADHILERAAANHGIPPAILHHAGATSGYEIELRHVGIRERRLEQEPYFREVERDLADLMALVLEQDRADLAFDTEGWGVDFGETQMPLSPKEDLEIFETERRLGLKDTVEKEQERNPDLEGNDSETWVALEKRVSNELRRNVIMRPLQAVAGTMGAEMPGEPQRPQSTEDEPRDAPPRRMEAVA